MSAAVSSASPPPPASPAEPAADVGLLVVDDHELVGTSLVLGLRTEGFAAELCRPGTADDVLAAAAEMAPDLVLLDLDLGRDNTGRRIDGLGLVAPLVQAGRRVLVLSGTVDQARVGGALAAGAEGWVSKSSPLPALLRTVRELLAGREVVPAVRRRQLVQLYEARAAERRALLAKLERLTPREREVLAKLAAGVRAQAVADHFVVSLATVRTQIRAVLSKLEVGSQLEAVALYRRTVER